MDMLKKYVNKEMAVEFIMEMGRIALIAALPVFVLAFEDGVLTNTEVKLIFVAGIVAAAKSIDRALHETGAAEKGLTRF